MSAGGEPRSFRVPYGLDARGRLVARQDAVRGEPYACPACGAALVVRAGPRVSRNFAHRPSTACDGETALHRAAKLRVREVVQAARAGGPTPALVAACRGCRAEFDAGFPLASFDTVTVEARLASGRVVDVLLGKGEVPRLAVEVFVSHRVAADKATDLGCPWIEVAADELLAQPLRWRIRAGKLRTEHCPRCRALASLHARRLAEALARAGLARPPGYDAAPIVCHRCQALIPVFRWTDRAWPTAPPPEPRPRTVQWRRSHTAEKSYWANTCPHCRALQGDGRVRAAVLRYRGALRSELEPA